MQERTRSKDPPYVPLIMLLPTTLVGSYPQPEWLIDRVLLASTMPPRVRMQTLWRVPPE